jgi:hypothetical protein
LPASNSTDLDPAVLSDPARLVEECYRLISFEPGSEPHWPCFRRLFSDKAVLALRVFPEDAAITVMTMDEYMVHQMREGMKERGYSETVLEKRVTRFGDTAEARVDFEMHFGEAPPVPALDVFQLVHLEERWWIVSIVSDMVVSDIKKGSPKR